MKSFLQAALISAATFIGTLPVGYAADRAHVIESYGKLPLSFEANQGQTDKRVKYLARGPGYMLFLTSDSAVLKLSQGGAQPVQRRFASHFNAPDLRQSTPARSAALRMKLLGANPLATITGTEKLPGASNYFVGRDPKQWRKGVAHYASVKYTGVYPGIDLVYHGTQRLLEYDFVVAPGADPKAIDIRFDGASKVSVNDEGALVVRIGDGEVVHYAPNVHQEVDGHGRTVTGEYVLRGKRRVGFNVGQYDKRQTLVIDPVLAYSTYVGGSGNDNIYGIAVDSDGSAYIAGNTNSRDFPMTPGSFQGTVSYPPEWSFSAGFVCKVDSAGSSVVYCTYLEALIIEDIAVDAYGNAYVTGATRSMLPTTRGAWQTTEGGEVDAFVTKLNNSGSALIYSTYLGGNALDHAYGVAVDGSGNAYVTGTTVSSDFPVTPGAFRKFAGGWLDVFVTKLNSEGSQLSYSTALGTFSGLSQAIVVDAGGNAYVIGYGDNLPTTPNAFQTHQGGTRGFVCKLNTGGSSLIYGTYLEGKGTLAADIAVDATGNAYIAGHTRSLSTTPGAFQRTYGGGLTDGFVGKLNAGGTALVYATYLGGSYGDYLEAIAVDSSDTVYVAGVTLSPNFPITPDAYGIINPGFQLAPIISKLDPAGSTLLYSTYLGENSHAYAIDADALGNAYVAGVSYSPKFPITPGAFQTTMGEPGSGFVTKLNMGHLSTAALFNGTMPTTEWYSGAVLVSLTATGSPGFGLITYFSLDNGSYQTYTSPFSIFGDGIHRLSYYSTDSAGQQEKPYLREIKIDDISPVSHVASLAANQSSTRFKVSWSGTDTSAGIRDFTIYFADNNGSFTPWLTHVTGTQAVFAGVFGHTYAFFSRARDLVGNEEHLKSAAEAMTRTPDLAAGDVNDDGRIDCADVAIVKASVGKRTGQTGFDPRADLTKDGLVDIRDLVIVTQRLAAGTKCP